MSSPQLQPLTVLLVSSSGLLPGSDRSLDAADPMIDAERSDSADGALERIEANDAEDDRIDAVVCGHDPPAVDAVEFVTTLRKRHRELPVILLPGDGSPEFVEGALAAGATDVVQAPPSSVSPSVLANRIRQFVRPADSAGGSPNDASGAESNDQTSSEDAPTDDHISVLSGAVREIRHAEERDAIATVISDAVRGILDAPGVAVFLFDDRDNLLRPAAMTDEMCEYYGGETVFGPGKPDSITWRVFVTGDSLLFDDLRESEACVNEDTDARSSVFVPFGEHGVVVASTDAVGTFSERSLEVIELLTTTAEATLDRVESAENLRRRDRRRRERETRLAHLERTVDLVASVDRALVDAESREAAEAAVLECLVEDGEFDFAWIGGVDARTGELTPREWTDGGGQYLDDLSLAVDDCDEPSCRTARQWQPVAERNVAETLDGDGWERDALAADFHSVLSVPLVYEGVQYGVLSVYANRPGGPTEPLASVLDGVGKTTAYAINTIERRLSMLSEGVTELELRIEGVDDVLNVVAESVGTTVDCLELRPWPDGSTAIRFSAPDVSVESVLSATSGLVAVHSVTHVGGNGAHCFDAVVGGEMVGSVVAASGGVTQTVTADGRSLVVTVTVPDSLDVRTFLDRLARRYPDTELLARRERESASMARGSFLQRLESSLTDRQLEVLRTAHDQGFFQSPRDATGQDVADALGVSQPTISHHLRAGQGTLLSLLFGEE
ncbi:GAF domain-containing protein [Halomicrobium zhouii]|uniref:GAF domain-containing protein n=1 Tax=Halomicrobium zhouii TaxID=767519 RepID=A0A1I6LXN8_9EURY|nr:bacterio-opsin activator domain-containing protein [Halomicrobium zhouii]SFS08165.1 GAF domain-containing protein [Halomicrobium zhouii]